MPWYNTNLQTVFDTIPRPPAQHSMFKLADKSYVMAGLRQSSSDSSHQWALAFRSVDGKNPWVALFGNTDLPTNCTGEWIDPPTSEILGQCSFDYDGNTLYIATIDPGTYTAGVGDPIYYVDSIHAYGIVNWGIIFLSTYNFDTSTFDDYVTPLCNGSDLYNVILGNNSNVTSGINETHSLILMTRAFGGTCAWFPGGEYVLGTFGPQLTCNNVRRSINAGASSPAGFPVSDGTIYTSVSGGAAVKKVNNILGYAKAESFLLSLGLCDTAGDYNVFFVTDYSASGTNYVAAVQIPMTVAQPLVNSIPKIYKRPDGNVYAAFGFAHYTDANFEVFIYNLTSLPGDVAGHSFSNGFFHGVTPYAYSSSLSFDVGYFPFSQSTHAEILYNEADDRLYILACRVGTGANKIQWKSYDPTTLLEQETDYVADFVSNLSAMNVRQFEKPFDIRNDLGVRIGLVYKDDSGAHWWYRSDTATEPPPDTEPPPETTGSAKGNIMFYHI